MKTDYSEIKRRLKDILPQKRYIHSLGVAEEAKRLAALYGADEDKAYTAGLLHDCAKGYSVDEQIDKCRKYGVELSRETLDCPPTIHGFLGAELAKSEYGISDNDILNAVCYHTVGRAGMSLLEKIVYIADMTEVNRDFDGVDKLRAAVDKDLDEAVLMSVSVQLELQCKRRGMIHPNIIYMWNDLLLKIKDN